MSNDDNPRSLREVAELALRHAGLKGGRELARKAEKDGVSISRGTLTDLLSGEYERTGRRPNRETLEALATLAKLHIDVVRAAASVPQPGAPFAADLPDDADYITGTSREILLDTIRLFAQQSRRTAELEAELKELRNDVDRSAANTAAPAMPEPTEADLRGISDRQLRRIIQEAGENQYDQEIAARASEELERRRKADPQRTAGEENQDPGDEQSA